MNTPVSGGAGSDALGRAAIEALWNAQKFSIGDMKKLEAALTQPAVPVLASEPDGEVYSASCDYATVQWFKPNDKAGGDPKNSWSWPIKGTKVYLAAPLASEPEPVAAEQARVLVGRIMARIDAYAASYHVDATIGLKRSDDTAQHRATIHKTVAALASQSTPPPESAGRDEKIASLIAEIRSSKTMARRDSLFEKIIEEWEKSAPPESAGPSDAELQLIVDALDNSRPTAPHYPEPRARHEAALKAARAMLAANRTAQPDGGSKA